MAEGFEIAEAYVTVHAKADKASAKQASEEVANDVEKNTRTTKVSVEADSVSSKRTGEHIGDDVDGGLKTKQSQVQRTLLGLIETDDAESKGFQLGSDFGDGFQRPLTLLINRSRGIGDEAGKQFGDGATEQIKRRRFSLGNVDVSGALGSLRKFGNHADVIGRKMMSVGRIISIIGAINVFSALISGAGGFAAALVPILGLLAAIPALAASAAAAIGTLAVGLSGIAGAFKAFGKSVGGGGGGGGSGAADQTRSLQRAVEAASRGIAQAEHELTIAERNIGNAMQDVADAQRDLTQARTDATRKLADYQDQVEGARISEARAALELKDAQTKLQNLTEWGIQGTNQYRDAQLDVEEAQLRLKDATEGYKDIQTEAADAQQKGVEGDQDVIDAKEQVTQALQQQQDANYDLQQAQEHVALATQQLADAQEDLAKKSGAGGAAGGVNQFADALNKLSPNAKAFVLAVIALKDQWKALRMEVQDTLFEGVATSFTKMANVTLPTLKTGMVSVAGAFNSMALAGLAAMQTPIFQTSLATVFASTAASTQAWADATGPLVTGIANLAAVGAPFFQRFNEWIASSLAAKGLFWSSAEGADHMRGVLDRASVAAKQLWDIVGNLGSALKNMIGAMGVDNLLASLVQVTDQFAKWTASAEGQQQLSQFFQFLGDAAMHTAQVMPLVWDILDKIIGLLNANPVIKNLILDFFALAIVLGPILALFGSFLSVGGAAYAGLMAVSAGVVAVAAAVFGLELAVGWVALVIAAIVLLGVVIVLNFDTIKNAIGSAWDWVAQKTSEIWQSVTTAISSALAFATGSVGGAVGSILAAIAGLAVLPAFIGGIFLMAAGGAISALGRLLAATGLVPKQITDAMQGAGNWLYGAGQSIIQGLINGITNMAGRVKEAVSNVLQSARNLLPFSPAKEGPFSGKGWTTYSGASMVDGLVQGIQSRSGSLTAATSDLMGGASFAFGGGGADVASAGGAPAFATASTGTQSSISIGQLTLQVNGSLDMTSESEKRRFIKQVRDGLVGIEAEQR